MNFKTRNYYNVIIQEGDVTTASLMQVASANEAADNCMDNKVLHDNYYIIAESDEAAHDALWNTPGAWEKVSVEEHQSREQNRNMRKLQQECNRNPGAWI